MRAFLDSGSTINMITEHGVQRLGLHPKQTTTTIRAVGQCTGPHLKEDINVQLLCRQSATVLPTNLAVTKTIPGFLPAIKVCLPENQLTVYEMAHPIFGTLVPFDLRLGANLHDTIVLSGRIKFQNRQFLQFSLSSRVTGDIQRSFHVAIDPSVNQSLTNDPLTRFWEIDEIPKKLFLTPEEEQCEQIFKDTTRCADCSFSVSLPFNLEAKPLVDSFQQAQWRFLFLARRLEEQPTFKDPFSKIIKNSLGLII